MESIRKIKKEKPKFEELMERIDLVISGPSQKKQVNDIYGILKQGVEDQIKNDQAELLCQKFLSWDQFPYLALKLSMVVSCGPPQKELTRILSKKMRAEAGRRADFPFEKVPIFTNVSDDSRRDILKDWVISHVNSVDAANWGRYALACMLNEELTFDDYEIIRQIAKSVCEKDKPLKKAKNRFGKYISEICMPFIEPKVSIKKIAKLFEMTSHFEHENTELVKRATRLEIKFDDLKEELEKYKEQLQSTREKLQLEEEETMSLKKELELKSEQLKIEAEKLESTEKYWKHELERQLTGVISSIKRGISHEINEARLSINRERPNLEMALSRLKNIEDELGRL